MIWIYFVLIAVVVDVLILALAAFALVKAAPRLMAQAVIGSAPRGRVAKTENGVAV